MTGLLPAIYSMDFIPYDSLSPPSIIIGRKNTSISNGRLHTFFILLLKGLDTCFKISYFVDSSFFGII